MSTQNKDFIVKNGLTVNGDITLTGTLDGVNIAAAYQEILGADSDILVNINAIVDAVDSLSARVDSDIQTLLNTGNSLISALDSDRLEFLAADSDLGARLDSDRAELVSLLGVDSDLQAEIAARIAGDSDVTAQVSALSLAVDSDISSLHLTITGEISAAIDDLVNGAPGALDTLNELSAALGNDADFATTVLSSLALKADQTEFDDATNLAYSDLLTDLRVSDVQAAIQTLGTESMWWHNINSAVRLFGGIIQNNWDGTVRVGSGGGLWKREASSVEGVPAGECEPMGLNSAQGGKVFYSTFDGTDVLELANNAYNYIFIVWDHTYNNGDGTYGKPQVIASTNFYLGDWENDLAYYVFKDAHPELNLPARRSGMLHAFTVGRVYRMDNEITIRVCGTNGWNFNKRVQLFGEEFFPVVRARGLQIEAATGDLQFNVTEGVMWAEMANRFTVKGFDMDAGDTFTSWYKHVASTTTDTLAQLQTNYPLGIERGPYNILYSSTDDKYYRWKKGWLLEGGSIIDNSNNNSLTLFANGDFATDYFFAEVDRTYNLIVKNTSCNADTLALHFYNTLADALADTNHIAEITLPALSEQDYEITGFTADVDVIYVRIEYLATGTGSITIDEIQLWTDYGTGYEMIDYEDFNSYQYGWEEVDDYLVSKPHYTGTSIADLTALEAAYPNGFYNFDDGTDYAILQLQATDIFYRYDGTRDLGDRWVEFTGTKQDYVQVHFIGNLEGMNTTWPTGYTGIANIFVQTADGLYYEYSSQDGWTRVHGYVERANWLRFYNQTQIDVRRYNDATSNKLYDLPYGRYGIAWVYMVHDNSCHVVYGQDSYTFEEAQVADLPTPLPGILAAYSTLVGKITYTQGVSNFSNARLESPFQEKFISSGVSLHNDLAGLQGGSPSTNEYYHLTGAEYGLVSTIAETLDIDAQGNLTVVGQVAGGSALIGDDIEFGGSLLGPSNLIIDAAPHGAAGGTINLKGDLLVDSDAVINGSLTIGAQNTWSTAVLTFGVDSNDAYTLFANGHKIWSVQNQGAGSGLDADTLDGQQATAFQAALVSGTSIKTVNSNSLLGSGNISIPVLKVYNSAGTQVF